MGGLPGTKANTRDQGQSDQTQQTDDPALKSIKDLMSKDNYVDAYMALLKLDSKKYGDNKEFLEIQTALKTKLGLG